MQVEKQSMDDVVKRLRRIEGQIGGLVRMIEEGRECADVVTQLAAASNALNRVGFKIVVSGMRQCLDAKDDSTTSEAEIARLEQLFLSLA